jgi:hypothetical protein
VLIIKNNKDLKSKVILRLFSLGIAAFILLSTVAQSYAQNEPLGVKNRAIQGVFVGNESASVAAFEKWLGKPVEAVLGYTSGGTNGDWNTPDPGWQIDMQEYLGGSKRRILWSIPMAPDDADVAAYREIAAGKHNAMYEQWAMKILKSRANDTDPIYIRTTWELGGEWFPWTKPAQEDPVAYKKAFAQFAQSFHKVSKRFKMVWDFTGDRGPVEQWYPGDSAVDVISQDIYWTPEYAGNTAQEGFEWVKNRSRGLDWMVSFAAKHNKPMAISEWGVPGNDSTDLDGAQFIRLFSHWIATHNVIYATYWDGGETSGYDGKLSDNKPANTGAELKKLYSSGISVP